MGSPVLVLIELAVVFGGLVVFGVWQLWSLRRNAANPAKPPEDPPT